MSQSSPMSRRWASGLPCVSQWALPLGAMAALVLVALFVKGWHGLAAWLPWTAKPAQVQVEPEQPPPSNILAVSQHIAHDMAGLQLVKVESRPVSSQLTCNGFVGFNENRYAQIRPRVDGILRHIRVDVGATVHGGQELAVVDSATLGEYKASYVYAVVNVKYTEDYCERLRKLADQQASRPRLCSRWSTCCKNRNSTSPRRKQKLVNLGFDGEQIDKFVAENDTQHRLAITAPWDGVLVQRHAVEGEVVTGSVPVFAIADLATMWVHLSVYESDLAADSPGAAADVRPRRTCRTRVSRARSPGSVPKSIPKRAPFRCAAKWPTSSGALRANMFGKGRLLAAELATIRSSCRRQPCRRYDNAHSCSCRRTPGDFESAPCRDRHQGQTTIGKSSPGWSRATGGHDRQLPAEVESGKRRLRQGRIVETPPCCNQIIEFRPRTAACSMLLCGAALVAARRPVALSSTCRSTPFPTPAR